MTQEPTAASGQHYTFGDNDVAALRLRLLAEIYAPSSGALLTSAAAPAGGAVDAGCGPGYTTELLEAALGPDWTAGLDRSERLVAAARARAPSLRFQVHDVTQAPYPTPPASALYSRFLLTHLPDPAAALRAFRAAVAPGGVVVLEETATLTSDHPAFRSYYAHVEALQAHYRQRMRIGAELGAMGAAAGFRVELAGVRVLELPAAKMARLHALNLRTWGKDEFALAHFDAAELARVGEILERVAEGEEGAPPVRSGMGQAVLRA
jgi:trans-aconitate 2-methyltransferase